MVDPVLLDEWEDLWVIREEVMKALEEERKAEKIRAPLEAKVEITVADELLLDLLKRYESQLRFFWIVSQVSILQNDVVKESGIKIMLPKSERQIFLSIRVFPAAGSKCERCWNYSQAVGSFPEHLQLCERCVEVVAHEPIS